MIIDLGTKQFNDAYVYQKDLVRRRKEGSIGDSVMLLEHLPVFTVGRKSTCEDFLADEAAFKSAGIAIISTDRGGGVTYHGPGQLVAYLIVDLKDGSRDLHIFLRTIERVIIRLLQGYGIDARRRPGLTGVWVDSEKIASIGIAASNWVTYHGVSLNVNVDLKYFSMVRACGIKDVRVTSMRRLLHAALPMNEVKNKLLAHLGEFFSFAAEEVRF